MFKNFVQKFKIYIYSISEYYLTKNHNKNNLNSFSIIIFGNKSNKGKIENRIDDRIQYIVEGVDLFHVEVSPFFSKYDISIFYTKFYTYLIKKLS